MLQNEKPITIGNELTKLRKSTGLYQRDVAELTGIPRSKISRYENNRQIPGGKNLEKLLDLFEVSEEKRNNIMNSWAITMCISPQTRHDTQDHKTILKETEEAIINALKREKTVTIIDNIVG